MKQEKATTPTTISGLAVIDCHSYLLACDQASEVSAYEGGEMAEAEHIRAWKFYYAGGQLGTAIYFVRECRLAVAMGGNSVWGDVGMNPDDMNAVEAWIVSSADDEDFSDR